MTWRFLTERDKRQRLPGCTPQRQVRRRFELRYVWVAMATFTFDARVRCRERTNHRNATFNVVAFNRRMPND